MLKRQHIAQSNPQCSSARRPLRKQSLIIFITRFFYPLYSPCNKYTRWNYFSSSRYDIHSVLLILFKFLSFLGCILDYTGFDVFIRIISPLILSPLLSFRVLLLLLFRNYIYLYTGPRVLSTITISYLIKYCHFANTLLSFLVLEGNVSL